MSSTISSVADILKTVFLIMNTKPNGSTSILVITASPHLQQEIQGYQLAHSGVHRSSWSVGQAKGVTQCFSDLGYTVLVYKYNFVAEWSKRVHGLIEATDYENFDTPSAPSLDFDLSAIGAVLPDKHTYVELFGGGAPLFMSRPPAAVEVLNDSDHHVINFFDQLREPESFNWFFLLTRMFPVNAYIHPTLLRKVLRQVEKEDAVISAYLWYYCLRQVWALSERATPTTLLGEGTTFAALSAVDDCFPEIHGRLLRMQHESNSWSKILSIYDSEDTLFWVDPTEHGNNSVHIGSKSEEGNFDTLLSRLGAVKGAVALYFNHKDPHHGFSQRSELFADPGNGWTARDFKSSTVWLKNATFKEN